MNLWAHRLLVPLIGSASVFLVKVETSGSASKVIAVGLMVLSVIALFFGFISAIRAIFVGPRETLYIELVINLSDGEFRDYSKAFLARGLLYCTSVNTAMNDHIAQFVKGAHTHDSPHNSDWPEEVGEQRLVLQQK